MKVIAYTYDADHHCPFCAEANFGLDEDGEIHGTDGEGNDVHPVFDTDEWYANEIFTGEPSATLACGTCGEVIETIKLAEF